MRKILVIMLALVLIILSGCAADEKNPEKLPSSEAENKTTDRTTVSEAKISFFEGVLTAKFEGEADFSCLEDLDYREEVQKIEIYVGEYAEEIALLNFPNAKNLYAEITGAKSLDISTLENLVQFTLNGKIEELSAPKGLESVSVYEGTDISVFSGCENLRNIEFIGGGDLSAIGKFSGLERIMITGSGFDLSPLNDADFSRLILSEVKDSDLYAIDGCEIESLQLSDNDISDLGVLERLPKLEVLFLSVSGGENPYVIDFSEPDEEMLDGLVTTVDISLLKEFIENGGEIFLLSDENR